MSFVALPPPNRALGTTSPPAVFGQGAKRPGETSATSSQAGDPELRRLVERITHGDERQSGAAADQLIEHMIAPVAEALGAVESRPAEEQRRIRAVLSRLSAALKMRLFRADLAPRDRKLFDDFAQYNPALVEQLFADDAARRLDALSQIPIEPNTGASILAVAGINDTHEDVAEAAFKLTRQLKDDIVACGLTRYVADATQAIKSGQYGPTEQDIASTLAVYVGEATRILGEMQTKDAVPPITEALKYFWSTPFRQIFLIGIAPTGEDDAFDALGRIGDERAVPALLEFLSVDDPRAIVGLGAGQAVVQTYGDAALLNVLRIYKLDPADFGFKFAQSGPESRSISGFEDSDGRNEARRKFKQWYREHGHTLPATSQPTSRPTSAAATRPAVK